MFDDDPSAADLDNAELEMAEYVTDVAADAWVESMLAGLSATDLA